MSNIMFKMNGDVVLTPIQSSDLSSDFLFMDKRNGKVYQFKSNSSSYQEVNTDNNQPWTNGMVNNQSFLKIFSFIKKGKINTTYEPKSVATRVQDGSRSILVQHYVKDVNLEKDGYWVDVELLSDGILCICQGETGAVDVSGNWIADKKPSSVVHAKMRRVCELTVDGITVITDHVLV